MTAGKRLSFHTGVNEGAGHMEREGGGLEREERMEREKMVREGEMR